jgi:hypothetical protein
MLPGAANDAAPERAPIFTSRASAEAHAIRSAQRLSRFGMACPVECVPGAYEPKGGGRCFLVEAIPGPLGESTVRELSALERIRLQQRGIRAAIEAQIVKARAHDAAAAIGGRAVKALHERMAREERGAARELELRLHVSGVRPASALVDDSEPIFSADRDARVSL